MRPPSSFELEQWTYLHVPVLTALPTPLFFRAHNLAAREIFSLHTHPWYQFVYATAGTVLVTVADSWYVITPEQAIWVPRGVVHTTGSLHGAAFRSLYIADDAALGMPNHCTVYAVNHLLRALILEREALDQLPDETAYLEKVDALMLEQLKRLPQQDFQLPWPRQVKLRALCEALYANPGNTCSLVAWGRVLGMSARTLARLFQRELGLSFQAWRVRLRIFFALEWLCVGRSITDIALELGYASVSAFTYMFRQEMGCSPSEWLKRI